jgi:hypothetical protein
MSPGEDIAEEAGDGRQRRVYVLSDNTDFTAHSFHVLDFDPTDSSQVRIIAYRIAARVLSAIGEVMLSSIDWLLARILLGINDPDPAVRDSAFTCTEQFLLAYADIDLMDYFQEESVIERMVHVISDDTDSRCWGAELQAFHAMCRFVGTWSDDTVASQCFPLLFRFISSGEQNFGTLAIRIMKAIVVQTGVGTKEVRALCCDVWT